MLAVFVSGLEWMSKRPNRGILHNPVVGLFPPTTDLSQFSFPQRESSFKSNPLFRDSQTIPPPPADQSQPIAKSTRASISSTTTSTLGSVPFLKVLDSLRRLGFSVTAAESRALTKELGAVGGFVDANRVYVDAGKCFQVAKRIFHGDIKRGSGSDMEQREAMMTEIDSKQKANSSQRQSKGNSERTKTDRRKSIERKDRRDGDDVAARDKTHERDVNASSTDDVRVMSKLLAECRR